MCGRYSRKSAKQKIAEAFHARAATPTALADALGLVPFFAKSLLPTFTLPIESTILQLLTLGERAHGTEEAPDPSLLG
jgi:hypothetical protein